MTIDEIKSKVNAAEQKVVKIENTISKHTISKNKKQILLEKLVSQYHLEKEYQHAETNINWYTAYYEEPFYEELIGAILDIERVAQSITDATKNLEKAKKQLDNWIEKLHIEEVKLQYINDSIPQVIKDFLLTWKKNMTDIMYNLRDQYKKDATEYYQWVNKRYYEYIVEHRDERADRYIKLDLSEYWPDIDYRKYASYKAHEVISSGRVYTIITDSFKSKYTDPFFNMYRQNKFDDEWLNKTLTNEMNIKLIDLINRVSKYTGEILDASGLHIINNGLNGIIIGKDGRCSVETISAAGYNDGVLLSSGRHGQKFHFRVLVKPIT